MTKDERLGKRAYDTMRELFQTGELSWDQLEVDKSGTSPVREKWKRIALSVLEEWTR